MYICVLHVLLTYKLSCILRVKLIDIKNEIKIISF